MFNRFEEKEYDEEYDEEGEENEDPMQRVVSACELILLDGNNTLFIASDINCEQDINYKGKEKTTTQKHMAPEAPRTAAPTLN